MASDRFESALAEAVWRSRYRYADDDRIHDQGLGDTWRRVALALGGAEPADSDAWSARFLSVLEGFRFMPGGRILAGAGTDRPVTLFNCFVAGPLEDGIEGVFDGLKEAAITMQDGGGIGCDFSTLCPRASVARRTGRVAPGPVALMQLWDATCAAMLSGAARRGAMIATLRCDHPDIVAFVDAKRDPRLLRHFNLSVQVTEAFLDAVAANADWPLVFPAHRLDAAPTNGGARIERQWPGEAGEVACRVMGSVPARALWERIVRAAYDVAEPGVLFVDRINRLNNLWYREDLGATNPCGEAPLPAHGACNLGSINLAAFVRAPFGADAALDEAAIAATVRIAVRMLDDVIDVSRFPLAQQAREARGARRIGLGITGLADALIMLGLDYAGPAARALAADTMADICHTAYRTSVALAREKGPFVYFDRDRFLAGRFVRGLPDALREDIARFGIRNSHLTAIAPTGTISLLAGNLSSGIEPAFDARYMRRVIDTGGGRTTHEVEDFAVAQWRRLTGDADSLPPAFVNASSVPPEAQLAMQAALQPFVDGAISKTVNVPRDYPFDAFKRLYRQADEAGLKGCTLFRPNDVTGAILEVTDDACADCGR